MGNKTLCIANNVKVSVIDISNTYQEIINLFLPSWYIHDVHVEEMDYETVMNTWKIITDENNFYPEFHLSKYTFNNTVSMKSNISAVTDNVERTTFLEFFFYEFYNNLFTLHPNLRPLFKNNINLQGRKLVTMLDFLITNMKNNKDELVVILRYMVTVHTKLGIKPNQYCIMMSNLFYTLTSVLKHDVYDSKIDHSWKRVISKLLSILLPMAVYEDLKHRYIEK